MTLHDNTNVTTAVSHYSADVSKYLLHSMHSIYVQIFYRRCTKFQIETKKKSLCNDCIIQ